MKYLLTRRSIREYSEKDIKEDVILDILKDGISAPSARNQQPWEFITITDKDMINELSSMSKHSVFIKNAKVLIVVLSKPLKLLSTPDMMPQDLSMASMNIMTSSRSKGIGSCYLGVYPRDDRMNFLKDKLSIKDDYIPFSMIALGYPKDKKKFKEVERDLSSILHKERF